MDGRLPGRGIPALRRAAAGPVVAAIGALLAALAAPSVTLAAPASERPAAPAAEPLASLAAQRVRVGLLSLEAPPGAERALRNLAFNARSILPQIESDLGLRPARRFRMILIPPGGVRDSELVRLDASAPSWAAGYYIPALRIGVIRIDQASRYPYGTIESVLAHEATHALIHDAVGEALPRWFEEGVATWQGRRWSLRDVMIYSTILASDLPRLADLDSAFHASPNEAELAYAASFAFVSRAIRHHPGSFLRDLLRQVRSRPFADAWQAAAGVPLERDETAWRRESLWRYRWIPILTASSTLWIGITFLAVVAALRKRARVRQRREELPDEELEPLPEPQQDPDEIR